MIYIGRNGLSRIVWIEERTVNHKAIQGQIVWCEIGIGNDFGSWVNIGALYLRGEEQKELTRGSRTQSNGQTLNTTRSGWQSTRPGRSAGSYFSGSQWVKNRKNDDPRQNECV